MLRLSPPGAERFLQASSFGVSFGGSEANVAVTLAQAGLDACFVTRLPEHAIGQAAVNHLRRFGVNTHHIVRGGDRIGIYFLETGASQRPSQVIYDRSRSAVSTMEASSVDWERVFDNADWFHWSGITPALGPAAEECIRVACQAARNAGAVVSCDLNYRKKLWAEHEAQAVMTPLMEFVDVCIANEEDAHRSLGIQMQGTDIEKAQLDERAYGLLARQLMDTYAFSSVAITLRESFSASRNGWSALMLDTRDCVAPYRSRRYDIQVVDRVGAGDSFAGGLICGLLRKDDSREALEYAVAASCLKHAIPGDFNLSSVAEIEKLRQGSGSGRVER